MSDRQDFNRWFVRTYADADGKFTHLPHWLKADMWEAYQAGLRATTNKQEGAAER